jgi:hypothetical protein
MARPPVQHTMTSQRWWIRVCQRLRPGLAYFWSTVVLVLALNIATTWFTTKWANLKGTPLEWITQHLLFVLACGGALVVLSVVVGVLGRQEQDGSSTAHPPPALPTERDRSALIRLLSSEYRRQLAQSLQGAAMMALEVQERPDVTLSSVSLVSWHMDAPGERSLAAHSSIVQAYDEASAGLLILGAPGAGKSTLLRELACELLTRAEQDPAHLVPVILNLSSWASKKPPLTTWLVDQLQLEYAIPPRLGQAWIAQDQLLLLLDGLDEVETSARTACIESINAYRGEHFVPLVVCSRSQEYLTQEGRLRVPVAVEVQPLILEQVDGYLKRVGKPLAAVRAAMRSNAVLRKLITTPLMLSVVMLAYHGKTAKDLPQLGPAEEQQRQVFEHYVTRMLEQRARKWHYTSQQTRKWLIWLAEQMKQHQLTEFYLERLQPTWLSTKRPRIVYALLSGLVFGLVGGLVGELLVGRVVGLLVGLGTGLFLGLLFGLIFGLVYGGMAYLQHYCLRYLLWRSGAIPWHFVRFLEEANEHILLQRVGGGYRFIHPLFLDYFASLSPAAPPHAVQQP